MLGFAATDQSRSGEVIPRLTGAGVALGAFGSGFLNAINMASRSGSVRPLRTHRKRLENHRELSDAELLRIERDFLATDVPIVPWVVALPSIVGSAVALAPVFDGSYDGGQRAQSAVWGGLGLVFSFWSSIGRYDADVYRSRMAWKGIEVSAGPSSILLQGTF
jgi:hypothetical protein